MKPLLVFLCCVSFLNVFAQSQTEQLRNLYFKASGDKALIPSMAKRLEGTTLESGAELYGYKAVSVFLTCRVHSNPYTKMVLFQQGKEMMETAIFSKPESVELRFLRFSVQIHLPFLLGYDGHIESDKKIMLDYLSSKNAGIDVLFRDKIRDLLLTSDLCNQTEKKILIGSN